MGNPQKVSQHVGLRSLASARRSKDHNNNGALLLVIPADRKISLVTATYAI
jgi:hypothetical protein